MSITCFLFDLDGTLVDSAADLTTAINKLRAELDLADLDEMTVRSFVGDGARLLVSRALPPGHFREVHLQRFLFWYQRYLLDQTRPYPNITEFLEAHEQSRMAVVTNKPFALSCELLNGLGLSRYFAVVIGGDSCPAKKPDPLPLHEALRKLNALPQHSIMIGDHHTDLRAGLAAGTATCFCAWGLGHDDGLDADYRAESPRELLRLFPGNRL